MQEGDIFGLGDLRTREIIHFLESINEAKGGCEIKTWFSFRYSSYKIRKTQNEQLNIVCQNSISLLFGFVSLAFCSRNYWSKLNHHLMAKI